MLGLLESSGYPEPLRRSCCWRIPSGYREEIWWPDCLDRFSGQFLAGDCLRELNHLDAAGAGGSNPLVPARVFKGCGDILTKKSSPGTTIYNTIERVLTPGLNFSFRVSEVTGRRRAGRMSFGPPPPRAGGFFAGEPDQGPRDF